MTSFQSSHPRPSPAAPTPEADLLKTLYALPGLKEIVTLRQVHALEHATVWVLSEMMGHPSRQRHDRTTSAGSPVLETAPIDNEKLSGLSTHEGFYVYGQVSTPLLCRAVRQALQRLIHGEQQLAIHPRCGTNLAVGLTLTLGLGWGAHLLLPKHPIVQLLGVGTAMTIAQQLTPEVGAWAQQHLTTALPWNLMIRRIYPLPPTSKLPGHFVQVAWQDHGF